MDTQDFAIGFLIVSFDFVKGIVVESGRSRDHVSKSRHTSRVSNDVWYAIKPDGDLSIHSRMSINQISITWSFH